MKPSLLALLALLGAALPGAAQESPLLDAAAPPEAPWVAPVPAAARWRIAVTPSAPPSDAPAENAPPVLKEIRVARTAPIKHDFLVYSDGTTEECWYLDKTIFQSETYSKKNIYASDFVPGSPDGLGDPVRALGYTGFDWVGAKSYDGTVTFQGVSCYHYRKEAGGDAAEAWVRVPDKLPVAYRMHGVLYVYAFSPPPGEALGLPASCEAVWNLALQQKKQQALFSQDLGKH
ncbi:MAG TPA: hypothetical protein VIM58_00720 [Candidatus Methylacidiphilales bacterium]